ncbi:hypothetical protein B296_00013730 [Ensete ventricosum]|uniref:Uncharacterized protein n=1 Tax=Ensete ventricosum TaxID=4639 RepID=A0A427B1K6_ENSVE|nr:hypothetical protein B296_00013730 [Ensete ventricosum]
MGFLGSLPVGKTYGSLDLGGSSLQVTFETETPTQDDTGVELRIASASHHLSAYSLSGYGLNDAFDKSVAHLFRKIVGATANINTDKLQLKHPCLNTGYREEYTCSRCSSASLEGSPLIGGKTMTKGLTGTTVELLGAPEWDKCSALAKLTVNHSAWSNLSSGVDCEVKPCALTDGLPHPHGKFYAMSGFYVVFRFFNLSSEASLEDVLKRGQDFCGETWEDAKNSVAPQPFIEQYCFRAPYVASLLRDGLHIKDNEVIIGSGSITWTLGVALLEAGQTLSNIVPAQEWLLRNPEMMLLSESSVHPLVVSHSSSSGSLGQMQFGNGAGTFWPPHRGQATLSSRKSQSREDLDSSLAEAHMVKI